MTRWLVVRLVLATGVATAAPVPKALKRVRPLRATIEPLPGEKLHSVDWDDVPLSKVLEDVENQTGLFYRTRDVPKVKIRLKADKVCMPELFARLDEELYPQGWVLIRKTQSFSIVSVEAKIERVTIPTVTVEELRRRSRFEPVQVLVPVGEQNAEAGKQVAAGIDGPWFEACEFGSDKFLLCGRVMDLQKFVDELGDHIKK